MRWLTGYETLRLAFRFGLDVFVPLLTWPSTNVALKCVAIFLIPQTPFRY